MDFFNLYLNLFRSPLAATVTLARVVKEFVCGLSGRLFGRSMDLQFFILILMHCDGLNREVSKTMSLWTQVLSLGGVGMTRTFGRGMAGLMGMYGNSSSVVFSAVASSFVTGSGKLTLR